MANIIRNNGFILRGSHGNIVRSDECCCQPCVACGCQIALPPEITVTITGYRDSFSGCFECDTEINGAYIFDLSSGPDSTVQDFGGGSGRWRCCWILVEPWGGGGPCLQKAVVFSIQGSGLFDNEECQNATTLPADQFDVQVVTSKPGEPLNTCLTPGGVSNEGGYYKIISPGDCSNPFGTYTKIQQPLGIGDCNHDNGQVRVS